MKVRLNNYFLIFCSFASENKLTSSRPIPSVQMEVELRKEHCPLPPTPSPAVIFLFTVSLRRPHDLNAWIGVTYKRLV